MATTQALGQVEPAATTVTDIYTVPASKRSTVKVSVANRGATSLTYRLSLAPLGAADATAQYFVYDETLGANASGVSPALVMATTDVIRAYTDTATLVVTVNGIEQDV
jgi:Fe-S cluster assembly iron-binding protein IscA